MQELDEAGLIWYPNSKSKRPRLKRYLDEQKGTVAGDVWTDIPPINSQAAERLGYPTQKPLTLLERIISASSDPGDVVLDPFAGCGTSVDAAQKLGRQWVGIDITYIAIDLILKRLQNTYGIKILETAQISGVPRDLGGAKALFERNHFDFERWAVSLIDARPNDKQVGDKGIDGVARFVLPSSKTAVGRIIASVKGGKSLNPAMVRDLIGTLDAHKAELGILITVREPTSGMVEVANKSGSWTHPANGQTYPRVQIITVADLLAGIKPNLPTIILPYVQAKRKFETPQQALSVQGML
jgi:site-specific DNA-methyltransferase (adenine-specific)